MEKVVYINNDELQIFEGKKNKKRVVIKSFEVIPLEDESVLNCMIFKEEIVINALIKYRKKLNNCVVILESSNIYTKRLSFPKLSKKQIKNLIKNEFMLSDSGDDFLYDANIKFNRKSSDVICCAVPKSMILSYINIFKQAGIKIKRIDIAINGFIKYINTFNELVEGTFVFNVMAKKTLLSILFHEGLFVLSNRSRITEEPDTQEFLFSIYSRFSTMVQFSKSERTLEKSEFEVTKGLYVGLLDANIESIQSFTNEIEIKALHDYGSEAYRLMLDASIYPLLGLFKDKDDINILKTFVNLNKSGLSSGQRIARILFFAMCAVAAGTSYFMTLFANGVLKEEIASLKFSIATNSSLSSELSLLESKQVAQRKTIEEIELIVSAITELSAMDKETMETILRTESDTMLIDRFIYDAIAHSVSIEGSGVTEYDASDFVVRLKETNLFAEVTYTGYSYITNADERSYNFSVQAVLKRRLDGE